MGVVRKMASPMLARRSAGSLAGCSTSARGRGFGAGVAFSRRHHVARSAKPGEADPLRERIYLEDSGRGHVLKPEPLPVLPVSASRAANGAPSSGVEMLLNGFDEKLNQVEDSPPRVAEAFNDAISSETGKSVRKGMVQAAKLTVDAS